MVKWLKRSTSQSTSSSDQQGDLPFEHESAHDNTLCKNNEPERSSLFSRFKQGLSKTRHQLGASISRLLLGKKSIDAELLEELESILIRADLGVDTAQMLLQQLQDDLSRKQLADGEAVLLSLKNHLQHCLMANTVPLATLAPTVDETLKRPFVILMVGVNGAGKTTTIGKLAKLYQRAGKKVMLAAGDTFRTAAVEQLQVWGERNQVPVIAQHTGADSASVVFDALQAATARGMDVLIADTAGRLHTQHNLMEELKKVKRVLQKIDPTAPHETMLILDASIGQNALVQAKQFHDAVGVTGITMTKLDGTAKGGILFAIAHHLKIPFRYLGMGEGIDDLRPFDAIQCVDAIFDEQ